MLVSKFNCIRPTISRSIFRTITTTLAFAFNAFLDDLSVSVPRLPPPPYTEDDTFSILPPLFTVLSTKRQQVESGTAPSTVASCCPISQAYTFASVHFFLISRTYYRTFKTLSSLLCISGIFIFSWQKNACLSFLVSSVYCLFYFSLLRSQSRIRLPIDCFVHPRS